MTIHLWPESVRLPLALPADRRDTFGSSLFDYLSEQHEHRDHDGGFEKEL